jgi:hypothetical protein
VEVGDKAGVPAVYRGVGSRGVALVSQSAENSRVAICALAWGGILAGRVGAFELLRPAYARDCMPGGTAASAILAVFDAARGGHRRPRKLVDVVLTMLPHQPPPGRADPASSRRRRRHRLHPVHSDELERQMKVAVIVLNPTVLVFVQLVAP